VLISEIEPIDRIGVNLLKKDNPREVIDEIIELPLRKACEIFRRKGIETVMSSANKNNILNPGEKPKEKEDVYGNGQQWFYPRPSYEDAGRGYAWIMINFDTLSDENKDWLFSLEQRQSQNGEKIGEKAIWFVHPHEMGNLYFDLRAGKVDYDYLRTVLSEEEIPQNIQVDKKLVEFEKRHIVLAYNNGRYPMQTVFLRKPINVQTTVEEVEEYFSKLAESFRSQIIDKKMDETGER